MRGWIQQKPMNTEALLRVADLVDKEYPINMNTWEYKVPEDVDSITMQNSCGYAACAIGHAMRDPWFNAQGFVVDEHFPAYIIDGFPHIGWHAVRQFFKLSYEEAEYLFDSPSYYNPDYNLGELRGADVAQRIRDFVNVASREII